MRAIKRFIALMVTVFMTLSLAGCGDTTVEPASVEETTSVIETSTRSVETSTELPSAYVGEPQEVSSIENNKGDTEQEENEDNLTPTQRNSINMLNYMTSLTQKVNEEKGNQMFLESAYDSFDNLFPNSVDKNTQAQITSLMDTIQGYRMISVKRDRLAYIYEQNRAQALRSAIPNPIGLLSAVESGDKLKMALSVIYMAVDSATSYMTATSQADLQFLKDGWELDDKESEELHNSTKSALNYMLDMVRNYDIPGDYALNKEAVEDYVFWSSKPDSQLERKISWFESNLETYSAFGTYWLELAKDYYNYEDYNYEIELSNFHKILIVILNILTGGIGTMLVPFLNKKRKIKVMIIAGILIGIFQTLHFLHFFSLLSGIKFLEDFYESISDDKFLTLFFEVSSDNDKLFPDENEEN